MPCIHPGNESFAQRSQIALNILSLLENNNLSYYRNIQQTKIISKPIFIAKRSGEMDGGCGEAAASY